MQLNYDEQEKGKVYLYLKRNKIFRHNNKQGGKRFSYFSITT